MKNLDLKYIPVANKKVDEYRKCNIKNITNLKFKENIFKTVDSSSFDYLKEKEFNTIFFINGKMSFKNLNNELSIENDKIIINKNINKPLLVLNYYSDENRVFDKKLIFEIKENINVNIIEIFISDKKESFISEQREFNLDKLSNIEYTKLQKLSCEDFLNFEVITNIKENGRLKIFNFDYGSSNTYNIFNNELNYNYGTVELEGFIDISKKQEVANIVTTTHNAKNTKSSIKVKHILDDSSHGIFEVKSIVNEKAKYSSVEQNSKTIILNDDAKINANPRLEIFIDELSASHGATTGSLDEEMLYYLQTRGLSKEKASKIILDAIEKKIINSISNEEIKSLIKEI